MSSNRDYGSELDALNDKVEELRRMVQALLAGDSGTALRDVRNASLSPFPNHTATGEADEGRLYYSGQYRSAEGQFRWTPQESRVEQLLGLDGEKAARILAALGHKQRLDILRTVLREPMSGAELVERLNMGTTGQLYHHMKALQGADLLVQEERGGRYALPARRTFPLLLLLAAVSELLDTSNYIEMEQVRSHAGPYLGHAGDEADPHILLMAVVDNSVLEHKAGHCTEVGIFLHGDGSVTVTDNGRGIPVAALPDGRATNVQALLTEIGRKHSGSSYVAPGAEKGISIAVVNALSQRLGVEIRREGRIYRQEFKHGIPQTELLTVGTTQETGTSVTFLPDPGLFAGGFEPGTVERIAADLASAYSGLRINVLGSDSAAKA